MKTMKHRMTVTVDPAFVKAGNAAVASGEAESLSAWVNAALAAQVARGRKLAALSDAIAAYEKEFGEITDAEMAAQARADRRNAIVIRGKERKGSRPVRSR